ncbi:response regulator transcription factor [Deinococcus multiflagellatus]|uniref:Response regulator transcription factor n=1 Tax=Deinococcus multiflagellatus TaxID=1656887 RepID=A0ABW1ZUL7_9DEIO|nr:response regulator transcription factor [Deinococcus multiflagellatus]MBZ9715415.1 response regulator transcription factor [Deinococcus multiflagellatus]
MQAKRILIIEDNADIAALLTYDLQDEGYAVSHASTAMTGLIQARTQCPDLILLDLGLPDADGRLVVSRLRKVSDVPILVLSARSAVDEKVELLRMGADDYLVKPYHLTELVARLETQLRRRLPPVLLCGELTLVLDTGLASYGGAQLRLTPTEFEMLRLLTQAAGHAVSRANLMARLWQGQRPASSTALDVHLTNVRRKLRAAGGGDMVRTVRGHGYVMVSSPPGQEGSSSESSDHITRGRRLLTPA